jgi:prepilin-type N-terminal cleavage/methylation domain-containing protein/prepilin-type processing-associated H-X9-DG protein
MQTRNIKGFTLIELLVVIAIIALLLAILMPSLNAAKERAKRILCGSNLKQISIGLRVFANDNNNRIPEPLLKGATTSGGARAYMVFYVNLSATSESDKIDEVWQLGYLFTDKIIEDGKVFYCPSGTRKYEDYVGDFSWPYISDRTRSNPHVVRTGYSYVPSGRKKLNLSNGMYSHEYTSKYSDLNSNAIMVADYVLSLNSLNHKGTGNKSSGINALFGDGHVSFCNNRDALDPQYWSPNPNKSIVNFRTVLSLFAK